MELTSGVVDVPAGRIHYVELGKGPTVLFLHGGLANGRLWHNVVPHLAASHRCVVPDLPKGSHREPMRPGVDLAPPAMARLVIDFMDSLGLDQVHLVTNDSGGAVGQILTAAHPDRVRSLVLTSCDTYRQFPPRYLKPVHLLAQVPGLAPLLARLWTLRWVQRAFYASLTRRPIPPDVLAGYVGPMKDAGVRRDIASFFRGIRVSQTVDAAEALRSIDLPVLAVWGADDLWFSRRNAARLVGSLPDARLEVLAECRTFVPEDQPDALGRLVADFLAQAGPAVSQRSAASTPDLHR